MVLLRPPTDLVASLLQGGGHVWIEPRLELHDARRRVQTRAGDSLLGIEPLVEDSRCDLNEGAAKPRTTGRAQREDEPGGIEGQARGHHASHPLAGLERPTDQVALAEHAVQVQVETR